MKLNPDCIRDILLTVEELTDLDTFIRCPSDDFSALLSKYSKKELLYHIKQCELSGFLSDRVSWFLNGDCLVHHLSPLGHKFLSDIRSETNWNKTKSIAKHIGSESLTAISEIAKNVISGLIQQHLGQY